MVGSVFKFNDGGIRLQRYLRQSLQVSRAQWVVGRGVEGTSSGALNLKLYKP